MYIVMPRTLRALAAVLLLALLAALTACPGEPEEQEAAEPAAAESATPSAAGTDEPETAIESVNPVTDTSGMALEDLAGGIIADFNDVWSVQFSNNGRSYSAPVLSWFDGTIVGVCDFEEPASGTFYCPGDTTLYLDRTQLEALRAEDPAAGDLAVAYAITHHLSHHIQNVLTYTQEVENMRAGLSEEKSADLTLRFELQADFFAGMWMHHAGLLPAEVTEDSVAALLATVATVADQRVSSGLCDFEPDPLTHGTAEQRQYWLWRGFDTGDISYASTFAADKL
jgi:predicted metalloprotease